MRLRESLATTYRWLRLPELPFRPQDVGRLVHDNGELIFPMVDRSVASPARIRALVAFGAQKPRRRLNVARRLAVQRSSCDRARDRSVVSPSDNLRAWPRRCWARRSAD